jgi:hypothetical protein
MPALKDIDKEELQYPEDQTVKNLRHPPQLVYNAKTNKIYYILEDGELVK